MKSPAPVSAEFLELLRRRDPVALARAVHEHALPLFRAARALGFKPAESEDLVQDVFVTFLQKLDTFEGRSLLRTWLFGVLHHKAMERRRLAANEGLRDSLDDVFESRFDRNGSWIRPTADVQRLLLSAEAGSAIRSCMNGLSVNQRAAFVLREVEELSTGEICKILGVSVTNFGVLIFRARARLRECLEMKGFGPAETSAVVKKGPAGKGVAGK